jgi:uncharacterized membrane protein
MNFSRLISHRHEYYRHLVPAFFLSALLVLALACTHPPEYPEAVRNGSDVAIEVSTLKPEQPQFHTYHLNKKNINYFVVQVDGKVLSFLDACASCYTHGRGYSCEGGAVLCRHCGQKFAVTRLEQGIGGCYPIKIEGRLEKNSYRIPISALENAADKF